MHSFNGKVEDLIAILVPQDAEPAESTEGPFEDLKHFTVKYVMNHDSLPEDHQVISQIKNSPSVEDMEMFLRNNLDYCDDCMVKLFKAFFGNTTGEEETLGRANTAYVDHSPFPPEVGPGCG